ncbi:hypothetical protein [Streptomyces chattanoogensis]|uniref:hypothetical protein n=1 Tax=Streptomyces chattanoogensis TaxID=66876 RepID=UPI00368B7E08
MDLAHALDGLHDHPWAATLHAYGSGDDLPDVLRALAGDDADAAEEAVSELYGSVLHQGTVYGASADVAPFLARIAASGHRAAEVLALLGGMAESEDEHGVAPGAVRAAVAAQLPLMLPLLSAADAEVRQAAAWAVSQTRDSEAVLPALRGRWEVERRPLVRAELLGALSRLDPAGAAATAEAALDPAQSPQLRIAAVFVCLDAAVPWSTAHHTAVLSLLPADPLVADRLDLDRREPLRAIVEELLRRDTDADRAAAGDLLDAALRDGRREVRAEALWAAESACQLSRSTPQRVLPALLRLAADAASVREVLSLLAELGPAAADAAPALAALASGGKDGGSGGADLADRALEALVAVAPLRAAPLLARSLGRRPRGLDAAAGFRAPADAPFPFDAELLAAVRARLTETDPQGSEAAQLTRLLTQWGERASTALPELYAALPRFPQWAAPAVVAVCPPAERRSAADAVRKAAGDGPLAVAWALYELTGESSALLRELAQRLVDGSGEVAEAARLAGELGAEAAELAAALRGALSDAAAPLTSPVLDADVAVAVALWQITGDAETVVPVLDSVFARASGAPWFRWSAIRATDAVALLGPAARPLIPRLEALLGDPRQAPSAVLALVAVAEPGSLDRPALAAAVLRSAGSAEWDVDWAGACDALEALGPSALTPGHLRQLTALAERDLRVAGAGLADGIIRGDDRLRLRVCEVLATPADGTGADPGTGTGMGMGMGQVS